jgi:chemotaxis protein CheD
MRLGPALCADEHAANEGSLACELAARTSVHLHPGQIFTSRAPASVTTILGSCVAVCVWDPVLRAGGVNHYLLPEGASNGASSARFGNVAIDRLVRALLVLGSRKQNLQAKVFGGACVLKAFRGHAPHLGARNVDAAVALLREQEIPIVATQVGGRRGRKLVFQTDDGLAWVKEL